MSNLEYFFASSNAFTPGFIPNFLASLTKLEELGLKSTSRHGEIPAFLGDLNDLILLDLDDNMLTGSLPPELGQLTDLEFLLLNRNELSGIPSEVSALTSLRVAFLDRNNLSGSLAPLCKLPAFKESLGDADGTKLLTADCGGEDPEVVCDCCTICCSDLDQDCNKNTAIPKMDPTWEASYNRIYFILGDEAIFLASDFVPAEP
jgi:Leucine-rich repeat (LRR) protein